MKTTTLVYLVACLLLGAGAGVRAQTVDTQAQVRYLSGTGHDDAVEWDFYCTAGRRNGAWAKIPVPSNWEQHGFGAYNFGRPYDEKTNPVAREQGRYRLRFFVPSVWRDKVVRLVFDGAVDLLGVQFDASEREMRGVRRLGLGPFRVWQNRTHGTRLDVWENRYNDTTPGESWNYPEFKGYFGGWRWATFETTAGSVTLFNESDDSYLGVYRPEDGRDGLLDFPETGLAVLDVIPAIGSKFQPPDQLGPQSAQRRFSGTTRGSVIFNFTE